jgi:hypothetical protein
MEIFLDGGLFEVVIAVTLGYMINFIFLKKYLLIVFSVISVTAPALTIFIGKEDLFYFLVSISIGNSILLVILLWIERNKHPNEPLIKIEKYRIFLFNFLKIPNI